MYPLSTATHMPLPSERYPSTLPVRQQMLAQPVGGNPQPYSTCCRTWMGYVDADKHSSASLKITCSCCRLLCPLPCLRCHVATSLKTCEQPQRHAGGSWGAMALSTHWGFAAPGVDQSCSLMYGGTFSVRGERVPATPLEGVTTTRPSLLTWSSFLSPGDGGRALLPVDLCDQTAD